jgi:hypothetical protein
MVCGGFCSWAIFWIVIIMNRCPICNKPGFEVVMFNGRYFTSCCNTELKPDKENE